MYHRADAGVCRGVPIRAWRPECRRPHFLRMSLVERYGPTASLRHIRKWLWCACLTLASCGVTDAPGPIVLSALLGNNQEGEIGKILPDSIRFRITQDG